VFDSVYFRHPFAVVFGVASVWGMYYAWELGQLSQYVTDCSVQDSVHCFNSPDQILRFAESSIHWKTEDLTLVNATWTWSWQLLPLWRGQWQVYLATRTLYEWITIRFRFLFAIQMLSIYWGNTSFSMDSSVFGVQNGIHYNRVGQHAALGHANSFKNKICL
jgi:hypothetical protein